MKPRFDDPDTFRLFTRGDTTGVRRFDHADALQSLRRLAPDRFSHLVAFQALNRMSTITTGLMDRYIERRHGREAADCEIPRLSRFFADTYGLPLYREQLQRIASELAGFPAEDAAGFADAFCRHREDLMPALSGRFVQGAAERGTPEGEARAMTDFFRRTAPFMLPEARLVPFAETGYRLAWLKVHRRADFDAALLDFSRPSP